MLTNPFLCIKLELSVNKKEAQSKAHKAMIKLGQFNMDAAKHIIPLKNVIPEGSKKGTVSIRLT